MIKFRQWLKEDMIRHENDPRNGAVSAIKHNDHVYHGPDTGKLNHSHILRHVLKNIPGKMQDHEAEKMDFGHYHHKLNKFWSGDESSDPYKEHSIGDNHHTQVGK